MTPAWERNRAGFVDDVKSGRPDILPHPSHTVSSQRGAEHPSLRRAATKAAVFLKISPEGEAPLRRVCLSLRNLSCSRAREAREWGFVISALFTRGQILLPWPTKAGFQVQFKSINSNESVQIMCCILQGTFSPFVPLVASLACLSGNLSVTWYITWWKIK
jgi:hypothetical protein